MVGFLKKHSRTPQEFYDVVATCCIDRPRIGFFESLIITVRTDTLGNFCQDFFLPTFIHHAMKTNDIGVKIITGFAFLIIDICTLPIRIITLLPRYYVNGQSPKEAHPLYRYLTAQKGVDLSFFFTDYIQLELETPRKTEQEISLKTEDGVPLEIDDSNRERSFKLEQTFNFIDLPEKISPVSYGGHASSTAVFWYYRS